MVPADEFPPLTDPAVISDGHGNLITDFCTTDGKVVYRDNGKQ